VFAVKTTRKAEARMTRKKAIEEAPTDFLAAHTQEIAAHPESKAAFVDKGWSHLSRGEYDHALEAFEKAASLDSRSIDAQYGLGAAARLKGDKERARQAFQRAIEISEAGTDAVKGAMMGRMARWSLRELQK
jgi:tetratricopeptide (TPR) repeat protein